MHARTVGRRTSQPNPPTGYRVGRHRAMVNRMPLDAQTPVPSTRRLPGGPFTRWPRAADALLALVVFLAIAVMSPQGPDDDLTFRAVGDVSIAALLVFLVASGVLYWRRSQPLVVFGVTLGAAVLSSGLDDADM